MFMSYSERLLSKTPISSALKFHPSTCSRTAPVAQTHINSSHGLTGDQNNLHMRSDQERAV